MEKLTLTDLQFNKVDSPNAPHTVCNQCGQSKPIHGGYMAEVKIATDADHSFFVCSSECMVQFHAIDKRDLVDDYINFTISKTTEFHNS